MILRYVVLKWWKVSDAVFIQDMKKLAEQGWCLYDVGRETEYTYEFLFERDGK